MPHDGCRLRLCKYSKNNIRHHPCYLARPSLPRWNCGYSLHIHSPRSTYSVNPGTAWASAKWNLHRFETLLSPSPSIVHFCNGVTDNPYFERIATMYRKLIFAVCTMLMMGVVSAHESISDKHYNKGHRAPAQLGPRPFYLAEMSLCIL
jgi:hypothetical protein